MNMQYSPRTESMLDVSTYADVMRWVAQEHGALLFDRLGIMRYWNDRARSISMPPQRSMIWPEKFMIALAGRWRLRSSMRLI